MKKYSFYFTFLTVAVFLTIFAACGSGDIVDLSDRGISDREEIESARQNLADGGIRDGRGLIQRCKNNPNDIVCEALVMEPELSSSAGTVIQVNSSSSSYPEQPYSSSTAIITLSSSANSVPNSSSSTFTSGNSSSLFISSSSSSIPLSSSSQDPNAYPIPNFACAWTDKNGAAVSSVISGDTVRAKITFSGAGAAEAEEDCSKKRVWISWGATAYARDSAFWDVGSDISTGGSIKGINNRPDTLWPASGSFALKSRVECVADGKSKAQKDGDCPLSITVAPKPAKTGTISCPWTYLPGNGTNKYFSIGATLADCDVSGITITNGGSAQARCDDVSYELSGNTSAANNTVKGYAVATCRNTKYYLDSIVATVVPDPSLSGSCAWDTKNNTFGGGVSARVTTAPTIKDAYGRTCDGPYFAVSGTKASAVSAGLTVDAWNGNATQSMSGITIGATCAGNALTPAITCPNITVKDPNAMCEYVPTMCDGIALAQITAANQNNPSGNPSKGKCFFATSITTIKASDTKINGSALAGNDGNCDDGQDWGLPTCSGKLASVEKVDGGYYIYVGNNSWTENGFKTTNSYAPNLHPNCEAQK